jgi:hypothetical protein
VAQDGNILVVPPDAQPGESANWLPLTNVLDRLRQCPSPRKLLILDVMRPLADARLGILADDMASRVLEVLRQQKLDGGDLFVFCACSPGQVSLVADDMGQSVFAHYLREGLNGAADGYDADRNRNGWVTVRKLEAFVRARVERWAVLRQTRQTPVLLGPDKDFNLTRYDKLPAMAERNPPQDYPFLEEWKHLDKWWDEGVYRLAPRHYRQLQATLLRAEQRWRGERDLNRVRGWLSPEIKKLDDLKKEAQQLNKPRQRPAADPHADTVKLLRDTLAKWDAPVEPKSDVIDKAMAELRPKLKDLGHEYDLTVLEAIADDLKPTSKKIRFLRDLIQGLPENPFNRRAAMLLEKLNRLEVDPDKWPAQAVHHALKIERLTKDLANCDPQVFPWVRHRFDEVKHKRNGGEQLLCMGRGNFTAFEQALLLLREADDLAQRVQNQIRDLSEIVRLNDEALVFLPTYAPYLFGRPGKPPRELESGEDNWRTTVQCALELCEGLSRPPGEPAAKPLRPASEYTDLLLKAKQLEERLNKLKVPFQDKNLDILIAQSEPSDESRNDPDTYWEIQAILTTPFGKAEKRASLWKALQALDQRLQEQALKRDQDDDRSEKPTQKPEEFASREADWERCERDRAKWRAQVAIDLFRLGGVATDVLEELQQALSRAQRDKTRSAWDSLGNSLRKTWEQLPTQLRNETNLYARDRLSRFLHPFDSENDDNNKPASRFPTAWLRQQEAKTALDFLKRFTEL